MYRLIWPIWPNLTKKINERTNTGPIYKNLWQCCRFFESGRFLILPRATPTVKEISRQITNRPTNRPDKKVGVQKSTDFTYVRVHFIVCTQYSCW